MSIQMGKAEFTMHSIRMCPHPDSSGQLQTKPEANAIILINGHEGASSYQIMS
jgi:hypothetical protein